jgi:hypothetical protein
VSALVAKGAAGSELIDLCLTELREFTGPDYEQEDDITLVTLERSPAAWPAGSAAHPAQTTTMAQAVTTAGAESEEVAR